MLLIWSNATEEKTYAALAPILATKPCPVQVTTSLQQTLLLAPHAKAILVMGKAPYEELQKLKLAPKNRTITSMRGRVLPWVLPTMVTFSVGIKEIDYKQFVDMLCDTQMAFRLASTGKLEPKLGEYQWVTDFAQLIADIEDRLKVSNYVDLFFDTETVGLDYIHPDKHLVSIQFSITPGKAVAVHFPTKEISDAWLHDFDHQYQLAWLLNNPRIKTAAANGKYDLLWLWFKAGVECTNYTFDTTLVGSLLDENRSNGLDIHAKIYVPSIGGYCVDPATRIWKDDLTWYEAKDVRVGDVLVGFDEHTKKGGARRCLRRSVVESVERLLLPRMRITTSRGRSVVVSTNHAWLVKKSMADMGSGNMGWVRTDKLKVGQRIKAITDVVTKIDTFDGGWVSGFLDGEGHLYRPEKSPRLELGWAQKPGPVWDKAIALIAMVAKFHTWDGKSAGVCQAKASTYSALNIMQAFRPARLLGKDKWEGITLPQEVEPEYITGVEDVGPGEVVSIKTSTHTFVAEGLASHNSDEFDRTIDKSRMDLVPPERLLPYACGDVDAGLQVKNAQKAELLKDPELTRFYITILHPAAKAFERIERGGIVVDMEAYKKLEAALKQEIHTCITKAKKVLGGRLVAKHMDPEKEGGINLSKASLLNDFMFSSSGLNLKPKMLTEKTKEPSTSMEHMEMFKDVPEAAEFVSVLGDYASASKMLSTYVVGFQKHIRSDGRFHPTHYLFVGDKGEGEGGTNTGRISVRDPAIQCLKGSTRVLTNKGYLPIEDVVTRQEKGEKFRVLTHTGKWRRVVGSYRNGVQPVFSVSFGSATIDSTANHPYLTQRGWVRTDQLLPGDVCYELRTQDKGLHQPHLPQLGGYEESVQQPHQQGLATVWGEGNPAVPTVARLQNLLGGYGGEASQGVVRGARECEWQLRAGELCVGHPQGSGLESQKQQVDNSRWANSDRGSVGCGSGNLPWAAALPPINGGECDHSLDEGEAASRVLFQEVKVHSIVQAGVCETFDLTVEGSHSFVAEGIVVHNTVPKHSKWGKMIRAVLAAPPGYRVVECDYSQGELKVIACIANEEAMIHAYLNGMDLHVATSGFVAGLTYEEMLELKKVNKEKFDALRQLGKAGNFGLIYGMGVDGFIEYARVQYGVHLTYAQAEEFRTGFFTRYSGLPVYHSEYKKFARRHQFVRSPLGRVRHLPLISSSFGEIRSKAERQAINSPVQGTLSDMMLWAMALMGQRYGYEVCQPVTAIHDASYLYVPEEDVELWGHRMVETMETLPFNEVDWVPQLKFTADAKFGPNFGYLTEMKISRSW